MPAPRPSLTVADVEAFVSQRCFPRSTDGPAAKVGVELEWLIHNGDGHRASLAQVEAVLAAGPLPQGGRLTLEPGGQLEISSVPFSGVGRACAEMAVDVEALAARLAAAGLDRSGLALDPGGPAERLVDSPRYRCMAKFFDEGGELWPGAGQAMMCGTAGIHVNLDAGTEDRWHLAHALGPVLIAAFANSPLWLGRPSGWRSTRMACWAAIDPTRTSVARAARGCVGDWTTFALDARVMLMRPSPNDFVNIRRPMTFGAWLANGHELGWPTEDDLAYHLSTLFPPVRPKGWLELRMIDALPDPWWRVPVVVATALLDHVPSADAFFALAPAEDRWSAAARAGLSDPALADGARRAFALTADVLPDLGLDAVTADAFNDYEERFVTRQRCPANDALEVVA